MADGSRGESDSCPKQMNNFTFSVPDPGRDQSKECSEDIANSDRVKLSFYTELDASESGEESDSRGVLTDAAAASASSSARALNSEGHNDDIEDRKKRCFDRYDSSESSDSGVVVLSPPESSACSSSDITEPRSPRSPDSAPPSPVPSDEGSAAAGARMPPWACEPAPRRPHPDTQSAHPAHTSHHHLHRRITEYFNHKMKPHNGLKRDATQPANDDCKRKCLPKNGHSHELEKYISYLSQTLSPRVLLDVGKQDNTSNHVDAKQNDLNKGFSSSNNGFNSSSNGFNTSNNGFNTSNTGFNSPSKGANIPHVNGLIDYSRKEKVHTVANGFTDHKQTPESSTKERSTNLNGFVEGKNQGFQAKKMTVDSSANGMFKKRYEEPMVKCKTLITSPNDHLVGLRVAKPDSTKLNDVVSSTTKLDSKMNGVTCGSNNISLNPLAPKLAPAKKEAQRKTAQPAKRTNRKSSACIANSKNLTWSKANNLKQLQLQKLNCANAVKSMSNDLSAAPKTNVPNGVRQVPVAMNGNLNNLNVPVPNLQNCHQINFQQQCNGTVNSSNLASFVVPQNVMLTALRIPQNGIPAQTVNHQHNNINNLGAFRQNVSSPNKLNGQFMFPIVQNLNGAVVQIPNLMAKVPTNFVLPQQAQLSTRQDHLQHQQAAQFVINGTILKLAHNMNSAYTNVNKTVPTSSQSIPANKNGPGMPPVGTVVQKSNYTVNLSHPMLVSQPGFIVTSVPNINVKETWSYTTTNTASSTQNSSCPSPIVHHPPTAPVLATFPGQTLHTSSIPIAPVKPPDNPIQGTDPPSSTVKEPDSEQPAPKCDIPWLTKTVNNNHVPLDTIKKRPFAQVCNLSEKLLDFKKEEEDQKPFKVEMETLRADKTSEEIRRVEEVARREETLFTQITVLKDVSSSVQNSVIDSSYPSVPTPESPVSPDIGIGTDKSMDSSSDSQSSASKGSYDSALSLSISVSSAAVQSQKSPILKQPKTLRFPLKSLVKSDTGKRKSSTDTAGSVTVCMWENCKQKFDEEASLLEHLQVDHVETQAGHENYVCQWEQCKVKGKPSCSRLWLERHALSHGGNKPFKCIVDDCGKRFSTQILLERHVNNHFREQSPNSSSSKKATDSAPKLIRRNGKKLRYRRQPWSARMFDFFDAGTMEGLAYRLQRCTRWRLGGGSPYRESNGHHTVTLQAVATAARYNAALGVRETLVSYCPADVLEDEWVPEKEFKRSRRVSIASLSASSKVALYEQFSASYTRAPPPPPPAKPRGCTSSRLLSNLLAGSSGKVELSAELPPTPPPPPPAEETEEVTGAKRRKQGRRHGGNAFWPCGR